MHSRVRFLQPEHRNLDVERFLLVVNHLIGSAHRAERRFQLAPRRVLEALARLQHRLLADDPRPANFLYFSERVEVTFGAIRIFDVDGHAVATGSIRRGGTGEVDVPVPRLKDGTYKVVQLYTNSTDLPPEVLNQVTASIEKGELKITVGHKVVASATLKVAPTKNPKTIDMLALSGTSKGKTDLGVYTFDGTRLAICVFAGTAAQEKRPTEFPKNKDGYDFMTFELKRMRD